MCNLEDIISKTYGDKSYFYLEYMNLMLSKKLDFIVINLAVYYENNSKPNDLDILLDSSNYKKAVDLLISEGFIELKRFISSAQRAFYIFIPKINGFIRFHLHKNLSFFYSNILMYEDVKPHCYQLGNFLYPKEHLDYTILSIESFFRKKQHYYARMNKIKFDEQQYHKLLESTKFKTLLLKLNENCKNDVKVTSINQAITFFNLTRRVDSLLKYSLIKVSNSFGSLNLTRRQGKFILFLGIDGSGKSTLATSVHNEIDNGGPICNYSYWGLKETLIQKLRKRFSRKKEVVVSNNGHSEKLTEGINKSLEKKSKILAEMFYFALSLAYVFDYWLMIINDLRFISNENNCLIVDRSYYDKLSEHSKAANMLFYYLLPKPDLVVRLDGDLQVFYERKKEFCVADLEILSERIDNVSNFCTLKGIDVLEVNTTKLSLEESVGTILSKLWIK